MVQPLAGMTVVDFTTAHQGPWATQKLGDLGAEVIKVERYEGEWSRELTAGGDRYIDGVSPFWLAANRSKRSINLDLKQDAGHEVALDLVSAADIVVENFRPGVMERLDLNYKRVREINSDVIYVSATGFGSDGPYANRPGQDLLLQALSGITSSVGRANDPPMPIPFPVVDGHSAMQLAFHTMAALFHRERTGEGQRIEINLLDSAVDNQCQAFTVELNMDYDYERSDVGIGQKYLPAPYGLYETTDGYIAVAMTPMDRLADTLDLPKLTDYDPFEDRDELKQALESHTRERTTDDLVEALVDAGVWAAQVNDFPAAATNPQIEHNGILIDVDHPTNGAEPFTTTGIPATFSRTPVEVDRRPPRIGEHTEAILRELGYDDGLIDDLIDAEVTGRK